MIRKNYFIFWPKNRDKSILVSDFLLSWSQWNLLFLSKKDENDPINSKVQLEVVAYFEYRKNNDRY